MSLGLRRLAAATAGALTVALTLGSTTPAFAQTGSIDPSTLGAEDLEMLVEAVGSLPLGSTVGMLGSVGSADFPVDGEGSSQPLDTPPRPVDMSIDTSEFREVVKTDGNFEYWKVTSAAMQREVIVEVVESRVTDEGPAPVLYMLDGVHSPEGNSGFNHQAHIDERLAGENVHVVAPTGAYSSYWTDWESEDPVLGHNKWETFLTEELPGIVEERLDTNGNNAIGGISMGGQAAMHLAATHPELYQGVMSFSGYYSTMNELGYQTARIAVETRGGDLDNMWGPHRSERWEENDTISHPEGLKHTAVYFSSGAAVPGPADFQEYGDRYVNFVLGLILEKGVLEGTKAFEKALTRAGIDHRVDYAETGLHNWPTFLANFDAGWAHIKPALQG